LGERIIRLCSSAVFVYLLSANFALNSAFAFPASTCLIGCGNAFSNRNLRAHCCLFLNGSPAMPWDVLGFLSLASDHAVLFRFFRFFESCSRFNLYLFLRRV